MSPLMVRASLTLLLTLTAATGAMFASQPSPGVRPEPPEPKEGRVNIPYWGLVTDLTEDSITIQFDYQKDRKPQRFQVSEALAAGKIPMEPRKFSTPVGPQGYHVSPSDMYRLTDVKVGDWVGIHYSRVNGVDICDHINIWKRPGGRVPPLPEEAEALLKPTTARNLARYIPYHEWRNAYWDLEDKGIPYPEKFGEKRRFPLAPEPRAVKPLVPIDP